MRDRAALSSLSNTSPRERPPHRVAALSSFDWIFPTSYTVIQVSTAYEKGFNTITLTDCCATTSAEGHRGATEGTFGMFSSPMTGEEFLKKINA